MKSWFAKSLSGWVCVGLYLCECCSWIARLMNSWWSPILYSLLYFELIASLQCWPKPLILIACISLLFFCLPFLSCLPMHEVFIAVGFRNGKKCRNWSESPILEDRMKRVLHVFYLLQMTILDQLRAHVHIKQLPFQDKLANLSGKSKEQVISSGCIFLPPRAIFFAKFAWRREAV